MGERERCTCPVGTTVSDCPVCGTGRRASVASQDDTGRTMVVVQGHAFDVESADATPTSLPADAGRATTRADVERELLRTSGLCWEVDPENGCRALLASEPRGQEAGKVREEHMGTLHVDHNMSPVTLNGALAGVTLIPVVGHRDCYNVILRTFVEPVGGIPQEKA